jgi:hypothetical protein
MEIAQQREEMNVCDDHDDSTEKRFFFLALMRVHK